MRAGPLRHRLSVLAEQRTPDGMGGYRQGWVEMRKVWAEITLPTGRVDVVAQQLQSIVTAEIRCRPAADLIVGRRLVHGATLYRIDAVLPDNRNSMLRLLCSNVTHP